MTGRVSRGQPGHVQEIFLLSGQVEWLAGEPKTKEMTHENQNRERDPRHRI